MNLLDQLMSAGLIQFGWFAADGQTEPVRFQLEMLASYPDILIEVADRLAQRLPRAERLLSPADAVPLATAVAVKAGIPLVYSQGGESEPAFDLVGAYDIGHPAVLVTSVSGYALHTRLLETARRVGLNVHAYAAIIDLGMASSLPVVSLFQMTEVLSGLHAGGVIPAGQAEAVESWLIRRPGSTAP